MFSLNKKIILDIVIVTGLFLVTYFLVGRLLYEVAFILTPHTLHEIPCLGFYEVLGKTVSCAEGAGVYTYLLYYIFFIVVLLIYTFIVTNLSKIGSKKNFLRVFIYSMICIVIIFAISKFFGLEFIAIN